MSKAICGIYKITNNTNGKSYIGQSIDIKTRWRNHKTAVDDCAIHSAIRKYGVQNFSFEIIEECTSNELNKREIYWMEYYDTKAPKGYNIADGGLGGGNRSKEVLQYDLLGNFVKKFPSAKVAAKELNLCHSVLCACCRHEIKTCGDFQWKYSDDSQFDINPVKRDNKKVKIGQYDLDRNLIKIFNSAKEASKITGTSYSGICKACNGTIKTSGGYIWSWLY